MAWIEAHQGLANHIKTIKLRKLLKIKKIEAIGILFLLWWWALDNAPDGNLSNIDADDLNEIVEYKSKCEITVLAALVEAGFIDENKHIHDWHDYAGKLLDKRKSDADRKKRSYYDAKENTEIIESVPTDIQQFSDGYPTEKSGNSNSNSNSTITDSTNDVLNTPKVVSKKGNISVNDKVFDQFWTVYPKKVAKQDALKAWKKLKITAELTEKIISAVNAQINSPQWQENGGQYIPNPATWLNRGQWDDEVKTAASKYRTEVYR
jgi:hypothetical protein